MNAMRVLAVAFALFLLVPQAYATWSHDPTENNLISGAEGYQRYPAIATDGEGGAFIAWVDQRTVPSNYKIYAQHVDSHGSALWAPDGVRVCSVPAQRWDVGLVADGAGGVILVWRGERVSESDIYAQRVDASGSVTWDPSGVLVCGAAQDQMYPEIESDGTGGAYIVWGDLRSGSYDIYAQLLDSTGDAQWEPDGLAVCTETYNQFNPRPVSDGQNGMIVAWHDQRWNQGDIYVQRLDQSGSELWSAGGVPLCGVSTMEYDPRIVSDGASGAIVTWSDTRFANGDVFAQRVDEFGVARWLADGIAVCYDADEQDNPELTSDGAHGAIICWQDSRMTYDDIYAQRVGPTGATLWTVNGVAICAADRAQTFPKLASDGAGGAFIAWRDDRLMGGDIFAQRIDDWGNSLWTYGGVAVSTAASNQSTPCLIGDGEGGGIVTWSAYYASSGHDIYAQRVERNGYLGYPSGEIEAVRDVPGDQGGVVNLSWDASYLDPWPEMEIDNYTLWRAISPTRGSVRLPEDAVVLASAAELPPDAGGPVFLMEERARGTFYWELVATVDAYHLESYSATVPTLFDSTATSDEYHYFQTIAHKSDPTVFWVSLPDSGRSVDNLAPGAPLALLAGVVGVDVELVWSPSGYHDEDLDHYDVHRSEDAGFTPDETTLVDTATDTTLLDLDPGPTTWCYRVIAEDVHGNEGDPSNEASVILGTGIDDPETPAVFALRGSYPNPLAPATRIVFDLPTPAHVTVEVYSIDGRHVATLLDGPLGAGVQAVHWDGTDASGADVPGGVYLYQVDAGSERARGKVVVVR